MFRTPPSGVTNARISIQARPAVSFNLTGQFLSRAAWRNKRVFGRLEGHGNVEGRSQAGKAGGASRVRCSRCFAVRAQADVVKRKEEKEEKMSFTVKATGKSGEFMCRRKTSEAALRKARELVHAGCYEIHIITPQGRDYHSSEFGDLPKTPAADRTGAGHRRSTEPSPHRASR